jgi:hypothetical protein
VCPAGFILLSVAWPLNTLNVQHSSQLADAAAQLDSLAIMDTAAAVAAAAVLPQQLPLRADTSQAGRRQQPETASAQPDSSSEGLTATAEADLEAEEAEEEDRLLSGDGSVVFLNDDFDDLIADDSAADAGMLRPEPTKPGSAHEQQQQQQQQQRSRTSSSTAAEEREASEIWYGDDYSGSGEPPSPQDADIAATLQAAVLQGEQPVDMAACLAEEGLDRPFSVEDFLKAAPAR